MAAVCNVCAAPLAPRLVFCNPSTVALLQPRTVVLFLCFDDTPNLPQSNNTARGKRTRPALSRRWGGYSIRPCDEHEERRWRLSLCRCWRGRPAAGRRESSATVSRGSASSWRRRMQSVSCDHACHSVCNDSGLGSIWLSHISCNFSHCFSNACLSPLLQHCFDLICGHCVPFSGLRYCLLSLA